MTSVALVQGASRGIGLSLVKQLISRSDLHVVLSSRNPLAHILAIQTALGSSYDESRLTLLDLDVTKEETIAKAAELLKAKFGNKCLRVLINSAGTLNPEKSMRQVTPDLFNQHMSINALGPLLVTKHFSSLLNPTPGPSTWPHTIVANISARTGSIGDNGLGGWYSYRASKAALNQITKTISVELSRGSKNQIISVVLHPGTVDTDLSRDFVKGVPKDKLFSPDTSAQKLFDVITSLKVEDNGKFYDFARKEIVW